GSSARALRGRRRRAHPRPLRIGGRRVGSAVTVGYPRPLVSDADPPHSEAASADDHDGGPAETAPDTTSLLTDRELEDPELEVSDLQDSDLEDSEAEGSAAAASSTGQRRARRRRSQRREVVEWVLVIAGALLVA